jgi:hypothetical protein
MSVTEVAPKLNAVVRRGTQRPPLHEQVIRDLPSRARKVSAPELARILERSIESQAFTPTGENVCGVLYLWDPEVNIDRVSEIGPFALTVSRVADLQLRLSGRQVVFAVARYYRIREGEEYSFQSVLPHAVWAIKHESIRPIRQLHQIEQARWTYEGWKKPSDIYTPPGTALNFHFLEPSALQTFLGIVQQTETV